MDEGEENKMSTDTATPESKYSYVKRSKEIMQRIMEEKNLSSDDVKKAMGIIEDEENY